MAQDEIHKGDIGTILRRTLMDGDVVVDISSATTKNILLHNPYGVLKTKAGVFTTDGTDGALQYTTIAADLDVVGRWRLQAYIVMPSGSWHSDISDFQVFDNLA